MVVIPAWYLDGVRLIFGSRAAASGVVLVEKPDANEANLVKYPRFAAWLPETCQKRSSKRGMTLAALVEEVKSLPDPLN